MSSSLTLISIHLLLFPAWLIGGAVDVAPAATIGVGGDGKKSQGMQ